MLEPVSTRLETKVEKSLKLHEQRLQKVADILQEKGVKRVLDLGCREGKFIRYLIEPILVDQIVGVDLSLRALEIAKRRIKPDEQTKQIEWLHSSLLYKDDRLCGYDAVVLIEVIAHIERLYQFEQVLFGYLRPQTILITTPNIEYNVLFGMPEGKLRHSDHRIEWTREEWKHWARQKAQSYGYAV